MSSLYSHAITSQPGGLSYLPVGDSGDALQDGCQVRVRYLQDTPEDAEFAAISVMEAFRGKFVHIVGESKLETMIDIITQSNRGKSDVFYSRTMVAEYQGRKAGIANIKLYGDQDERAAGQYCNNVGCYRFCRLTYVGCVLDETPARNKCYLDHICVDPEFRGKGIGKVLMDHTEREAREHSCNMIYLHVVTTNKARHLYEREGYQLTDTKTCCMNCMIGVPGYERMEKKI